MLTCSLLRPEAGLPGVLVRSAMTEQEQFHFYSRLCAGARGSLEAQRLMSREPPPEYRPWPLCVWRHPFTDETNSPLDMSPQLELANQLATRVAAQLRCGDECCMKERDERELLAEALAATRYDSLLSLLYPAGGIMQPHVDTGLGGLGFALSLGAACSFSYGGTETTLRSGDVLFCPFGTVSHEVSQTHSVDSAPDWWHALPATPHTEDGLSVSHFGRARCTVQIRDLRQRDESVANTVKKKLGRQLGHKVRRRRETV